MRRVVVVFAAVAVVVPVTVRGAVGPYSSGLENASAGAPDPGVPGFVGPAGSGVVGSGNAVNPVFRGWATSVVSYQPAPGVDSAWSDSTRALGPVTGDNFDVVSLGDLSAAQVAAGAAPGRITLGFGEPIANGSGADFAVFENSFGSQTAVFAEFAYVEVSSDGLHFARFPSRSLTAAGVGAFGFVDPRNVDGLAGKHVNAGGNSWGTPFDLADLAGDPLVAAGELDLGRVRYVRLADVPGSGDFKDSTGAPIYDSWPTVGSGGFDVEAVGVINAAVPEPGSVGLAIAGGVVLLSRRRRRGRRLTTATGI